MLRVLFSGQSNCNGANDSGGGDWNISSKVLVWNNSANRDDASLMGSAWVTPDRDQPPFFQGNNNQGVQFATHLAEMYYNNTRLVIVGRNGHSIDYWHDGVSTGVMYTRMHDVAKAAVPTVPYDVFLWNQGSADNNNAGAYAVKFEAMIAEMKCDSLINDETIIVLSETAPSSPLINPVLEALAAADDYRAYARIGSLATSDGTHFTGHSLVRAGLYTLCSVAASNTRFRRI